jgi:uncharacterized protein (DUF2147 family)
MKMQFFLTLAFCLSAPAMADPHDVYGLWLSAAKDGHIEIQDCGDATPCGDLVWADPARTDTDLDARNRDPSLRTRKLIGVPIVQGFERVPKGWRSGEIYNPEDGKTFAASLEKLPDGTLKVKGCIGPLCRTNIWTPVDAKSMGAK